MLIFNDIKKFPVSCSRTYLKKNPNIKKQKHPVIWAKIILLSNLLNMLIDDFQKVKKKIFADVTPTGWESKMQIHLI